MCGICGFDWQDEDLINRMNILLKHRGPDASGTYIDENISLGNTRLSIIDLNPRSDQPFISEDGRYILVYNGEIYNYLEIKDHLIKKGIKFRTSGDTEVVLKSYEYWQESCLDRFNGMFSFCIYDRENDRLFFARDRFGIKPLYYYLDKGGIIFSSEIKPILIYLDNVQTNDLRIYEYLVYNISDHTDETMFKGIKKIPRSHYGIYKINNKTLKLESYWSPSKNCNIKDMESDEIIKKFITRLKESIKLRGRSDVVVGSCLSGGLDSSSIVSLMKEHGMKPMTFSATYPGFSKDESGYMNTIKTYLNIEQKTISPSANDLVGELNDFIRAMEEPPRDLGQYSQYKVMQLAKKYDYKVLLDGQGSDELLAGYDYFYGSYLLDLMKNFKISTFLKEYQSIEGPTYNKKIRTKSFLLNILPTSFQKYLYKRRGHGIKNKFYNRYRSNSEYCDNILTPSSLKENLVNHLLFRLEQLLKWEDKNSMAFSIETRVPFLDYRLVEYTLKLTPDFYIRDGWTKYILRKSIKARIPNNIRWRRDKIGFATPGDKWLREEVCKNFVENILKSKDFSDRKYFNQKKIIRLFDNHIKGKGNHGFKIWKYLFLETWLREFID